MPSFIGEAICLRCLSDKKNKMPSFIAIYNKGSFKPLLLLLLLLLLAKKGNGGTRGEETSLGDKRFFEVSSESICKNAAI